MEDLECVECGCPEFTIRTNDDLTVVEAECVICGLPISLGLEII